MCYRIVLRSETTGVLLAEKKVTTMLEVANVTNTYGDLDGIGLTVIPRVKCPGSKRMSTIIGGGYTYCPTCGRQTWANGLWPMEHFNDDPKLEQEVRVKTCHCSGVDHVGSVGYIIGFRSMLNQRYYLVSLGGSTLENMHCWADDVQVVEQPVQTAFAMYGDESFQVPIEEAMIREIQAVDSASSALSSAALTGGMTA